MYVNDYIYILYRVAYLVAHHPLDQFLQMSPTCRHSKRIPSIVREHILQCPTCRLRPLGAQGSLLGLFCYTIGLFCYGVGAQGSLFDRLFFDKSPHNARDVAVFFWFFLMLVLGVFSTKHQHDWYDRVGRFLDKQLKQSASENVLKYGLENTSFGKIFRNLLPDRGRLNLILYPALRILTVSSRKTATLTTLHPKP